MEVKTDTIRKMFMMKDSLRIKRVKGKHAGGQLKSSSYPYIDLDIFLCLPPW